MLFLSFCCSQTFACEKPVDVDFIIHPIFDESQPDIIWLHKLANSLHIDTKPVTLENEVAFMPPCDLNEDDLAEVERHLRSRRYIRDAKVVAKIDEQGHQKVQVETWDNWSLLPTVDFGRKGGKNHFAIGVKDRNVLGLGIDTDFEYFTNPQRNGYKLDSQIPLFIGLNSVANIRLQNNNDGKQLSVYLDKPFVSLKSDYAGRIGYNHETRTDSIYQNSHDMYQFKHELHYGELSYGWLDQHNGESTFRYLIGYQSQVDYFESINTADTVPKDREFNYVWFGIEYIENGYKELNNIHLIDRIEDFNLGWYFSSQAGVSPANNNTETSLLWNWQVSKGIEINDDTLLLTHIDVESNKTINQPRRLKAEVNAELFYQLAAKWALYGKVLSTFSRNQFIDQPVTLGGDNNLRGYPEQYQHGDNSILLTSEIRYYPRINLFKLFELGGTAFFDMGRTTGSPLMPNDENGWLKVLDWALVFIPPVPASNKSSIWIWLTPSLPIQTLAIGKSVSKSNMLFN